MSAFIWVDPAGRILGMSAGVLKPLSFPAIAHCRLHPISDALKLTIEGTGADRFFVSESTEEVGERLGETLDGITIRYKQEIVLTPSKAIFACGEQIVITHNASRPVKVWAGHRPVMGKVHPQRGHTLTSRSPGHYTIKVRDARFWAEPLEVQAHIADDSPETHGLDDG